MRISKRKAHVVWAWAVLLIIIRAFADAYKTGKQIWFRPFCLLTERGSTKGKRNARRTAHRQPHQGGTQQAGAHHHLARPTARLLAPKRLQDLQPPLDLHRLAPQNLRPVRLRFLQMLFGLQEQQEKRMIFQGFVAAFPKKL